MWIKAFLSVISNMTRTAVLWGRGSSLSPLSQRRSTSSTPTTWCVRYLIYRALLGLPLVLFTTISGSDDFQEFRFTTEPHDVTAVSGRSAMLECAAHHSGTAPDIRWKKGGESLILDNRRSTFPNGTLYFTEIEHSRPHKPDEDIYQCSASVPDLGTMVSSKAKLTVAYIDRTFLEEPGDLTVHLGDMAMFPCEIGGAPEPAIRWFRNEYEIGHVDIDYTIHIDGVLEIGSVQFGHFGHYKCKAENVDRHRTSAVANLQQNSDTATFYSAPEFIMTPKDTIAMEGTTVTLYCGANGHDDDDNPPVITWLKDTTTIDLSDLDTRFSKVGQGSLQIDALSPDDSGTYTCRATNDEDSVDAVANLIVHVSPRFQRRPKSTATQVNSDVEFECEVEGIPQPRVTWLHNGDVITPTNYFQIIDGHNLKILGVVESDAGMYQCFAENEVGNIQSAAQMVMVEPDTHSATTLELPSTPRGLRSAFVSHRFITLSWQPPSQSGTTEITNYLVYFKEEGSNRERTQNTTQLEANVQHLKPGSQYTFRVVAYNQAGPSPEPAEITVRTEEELSVPGPPLNLVAVPLSPHEIQVTWGPPEVAVDIMTYKLFYYEVGARNEQDLNTDLHTEYALTDLKGYREYSFRVLAYNRNGAGESTEEVLVRTYSGRPSEPPQNVTVDSTSSASIEIHWEPPTADACNGIITGYKIRYRERDERERSSAKSSTRYDITDGNKRDHVLSNLLRKTTYQVRLQAMTQNGTGPPSEWISTETLSTDLDESTVPGIPQAIHVRATTESILISWTPPAEQDIMTRGYVLGYGINFPDVFKQVLKAKQRFYTIKNLRPDSDYIISLRAFNNLGEGQPKYETAKTRRAQASEPQTPMDPPLGLKAVVMSASTVVLTWTDMTLGDSQRINDQRFYTVAYNPKTSRKKKFVNSTDLNVHIDDLRPNTEYEFSVKVVKGRRQSPPSMSIFVKTQEAIPTTAPRDLTPVVFQSKPTWMTLSWQPPRTPNGQLTADDLTGYLVYYTTDATSDDNFWVQERLPGDKLSMVIRDLSLETTYYFKVQAKNSKGFGPPSPTVVYRTPREDGRGGGMLELPDDYGHQPYDRNFGGHRPGGGYYDFGHEGGRYDDDLIPGNRRPQDSATSEEETVGGLPPMFMWIIIGSISGVTVIVVIVVIVIVCNRNKNDRNRKKKRGPGYQPANKNPGDLKPPDLWIDQMEMKGMDKSGEGMSPSGRDSDLGSKHEMDGSGTLTAERRRCSMLSDKSYEPHEERYQRAPIRAKANKPIMISVDQPPPPREPIATAVPNGHLGGDGSNPMRPIYPRTQYTSQYTSTPRVNAGDVTAPPPAARPPIQSPGPGPQQATSPYKKSSAPVSGTQAQSPMGRSQLPVVSPRPPDVTRCGSKDDGSDFGTGPKSVSAEDLTAQMANLEGLMKDLNAITQQEFEC